jgi:hypothetical protein
LKAGGIPKQLQEKLDKKKCSDAGESYEQEFSSKFALKTMENCKILESTAKEAADASGPTWSTRQPEKKIPSFENNLMASVF